MRSILILVCAALGGGSAFAASEAELVQKRLAETYTDVRADQITPSPIPGLFELRIGPQVAYVSADGRFLVRGDIIEVKTDKNLTEVRRSAARVSAIDDVGDANMLVFSPKQVKHTVSVFTDVDCGYCRKLHKEIDQYMAQGIRVRYLFFPRSGPKTESWTKADRIWCSADRNAALTRAKRGEVVTAKDCSPTPVQRHYDLGLTFGIAGTPAIITETGELIPGYVSSEELVEYLSGDTTG